MEHPDLLLELAQFQHQDRLREVETWRLARIARQERARYGGHLLHSLVLAARLLLMLALLTLLCSTFPVAQAAPGDGDVTFAGFGSNGLVTPPGLKNIYDIAVQPDGKVVMVGYTGTAKQFAVYRYLPDGRLDTTFGTGGKAIFSEMFEAANVVLQSDGRIVVGGGGRTFQLARLTPGGALDPSFDGDGWVQDLDSELEYFRALLVQPDGKIVACGYAKVGGDYDFGVVRYTAGGARDTTFGGGDGKVTIPFGGYEYCNDVALQSDGKLVAVGGKSGSSADFAIARLESDGTLDDTSNGDGGFDGDGKLTTGFGGNEDAHAVAIQPDGKIVVLGTYPDPHTSYIARYLPSGALDGTFGVGGKLTILYDRLYDLALQPDGKLLALGSHILPDGNVTFALHRLLPNGSPDNTFDGDGIARPDFGGADAGRALALLPDGRILAAGGKATAGLLIRLWPDGPFDTGGQQSHSLTFAPTYQAGYRETVHGMALQPNGAFLVAGQVYNPQANVSDAFVTRFTFNGLPDPTFGTNGSAFIFGPGLFRAATAVAVQPDGKIVIAGYTAYNAQYTAMDFLVARFLPNGGIDSSFGSGGVTLVDFFGGADAATALALAPDGKIVVAGPIQGARSIWGVARLTGSGQPDNSFGGNGQAYVDFNGDNGVTAVLVQPDGRIILGGFFNGDFALHRLLNNGPSDPAFGPNGTGYALTDLGGREAINALVLAPNGWLYAAGYRTTKTGNTSNSDMALAQYTPEDRLASCADLTNCHHWPSGTFFFDQTSNDYAYALDLRADNQLVAAGCSNQHFAAVQVSTEGEPSPRPFNTDFVGLPDCAYAVKFSGPNKILLAGTHYLDPISSDSNIALARFETTVNTPGPAPNPTLSPVYLPIILR